MAASTLKTTPIKETHLSTSTGSSPSFKSAADTVDHLLSSPKTEKALLSEYKKGVRAMATIESSSDFEFALVYKPRYDDGTSSYNNDTMTNTSKMPNAIKNGASTRNDGVYKSTNIKALNCAEDVESVHPQWQQRCTHHKRLKNMYTKCAKRTDIVCATS